MKKILKFEIVIDSSLPTWYEQKMALEAIVEKHLKRNKNRMPVELAGLVLTHDALISMYQIEVRRVYKNIDRDIEITLDLMSGERLNTLAVEYGMAPTRIRAIMEKVFNQALSLTEGRHHMPDHEYWKVCEARHYSDYWIARVKQLKDMMS